MQTTDGKKERKNEAKLKMIVITLYTVQLIGLVIRLKCGFYSCIFSMIGQEKAAIKECV